MKNYSALAGGGDSSSNLPVSKQPKKYRQHKENMIRISLTISPHLLKKIDEAAEQDYTTRSDMIRMAVLWYLRPQGRELSQVDPDVILKTLQHRRMRAEMNKTMKDTDVFDS